MLHPGFNLNPGIIRDNPMNPESLYEYVLSLVCSVFDAYSAVLFLPEAEGERYYLAASFSLGKNIPSQVTALPGQGLVGTIIQSRQPLLAKDFDLSRVNLGYYDPDAEEHIKAFMGCPIPTGGALCVDSKRQYYFSEKDFKILQLFAGLIARQQRFEKDEVSENIPRYFAALGVIQDLHHRYKRWPAFLKNFLRTIADATQFDYCAFATLQENGDEYSLECESAPLLMANGQIWRIPIGRGLTGIVFQEANPVYAEQGGFAPGVGLFGIMEDMPDFPAAICMPIMVNRTCRGVLCLAHSELKEPDESMHTFLRQAVDHLGLFLENLYLEGRLQSFLPKAGRQLYAARVYNPDTAPMPPQPDADL